MIDFVRMKTLKSILFSRLFIVFSVVLFIVFIVAAFSMQSLAIPSDKYLSLSTLDANLTSDHYFVSPGTTRVGDHLHWNIGVYNHMGQTEYVMIRGKLLDPGQFAANDTTHSPSNGISIFEKRVILADNSSAVLPFNWSVAKQSNVRGIQDRLVVNGHQFNVPISSGNNKYRIVFELWVFDATTNSFSFTFPTDSGPRDVWNEVWFWIAS